MATEEKKTKGRRKIQMKKIENESHLLVTFSKRRSGLFKKACELCTLCDVELAIVVFSPNGKRVYCLGNPEFDTVIDRFLTRNCQTTDSGAGSSSHAPVNAIKKERISELNKGLTGHLHLINEEKNKRMTFNQISSIKPKAWWKNSIEELTLEQLEELNKAYKILEEKVINEKRRRSMDPNLMEAANHDTFLDLNSVIAALSLTMENENDNDSIESDSDDQNFGHGP